MLRRSQILYYFVGLSAGLTLVGISASSSEIAPSASGRKPYVPPIVTTHRIALGFVKPVFCCAPAGNHRQLFVVELGGKIQILGLQDGSRKTFLDVGTIIQSGGERGLLGLAFHPQFATNRRFYVNYTGIASGETRVVEYLSNAGAPSQADSVTARLILTFSQPQQNHNAGWMGFGPDGYLYIATGDGGGGFDMATGHTDGTGNGQDITANWLGKMLRVDVNRDDFPGDDNRNYGIPSTNPFVGTVGDDEIWAYGLRNPWRCGFDRLTGDLYIGDVGQNDREEIDFQPRQAAGGRNYGWRLREGTIQTPMDGIGGTAPSGAIEPVYDYAHGSGALQGNAVVGGYVYRGSITDLRGTYFFADYVNRRVWSFQINGSSISNFADLTTQLKPDIGTIGNVSSFGEDGLGELYLVDIDGELFKIVQKPTAPTPQESIRSAIVRFLTTLPRQLRNGR